MPDVLEHLAGSVPLPCRRVVGPALAEIRKLCKAQRPGQRPTAANVTRRVEDLRTGSEGCDCVGPALRTE